MAETARINKRSQEVKSIAGGAEERLDVRRVARRCAPTTTIKLRIWTLVGATGAHFREAAKLGVPGRPTSACSREFAAEAPNSVQIRSLNADFEADV